MNTDSSTMVIGDGARSSYARTEYARIRRIVRYPQTIANDERLRIFMSKS
jgi:hypothetical protein